MERENRKAEILLVGPGLNIVSGVSTHLKQLFDSDLGETYRLAHFEIGSEGKNESFPQKLFRYIAGPVGLFGYIVRNKPKAFWRDLIHLLLAKSLRTRVLYQVHGGALEKFTEDRAIFKALLKRVFRLPDVVVVLSSAEFSRYRDFATIDNLEIIPNAIDLSEFGGYQRKEKAASDAFTLVYVGRLAGNKGVKEAIEAVNILQTSGACPRLEFLIAGSGPAENELRAKVREYGLDDIVKFVGPIFGEQKIEFWKKADLFVFPTFHNEGLPYSVLESLASGTPLVTTRVGGNSDVVREGKEGIFVEPHDPKGVARAIDQLLKNAELLSMMSHQCVKRANEYYGIERMVEQFKGVYGKLCK